MGKKTRTVRISGVDYDFGLTSKDIKVIGLDKVGNLKEGDTIHAGTDLDSFIERLVVKEKYPTTTTIQGELIGYFTTKPTVSLDGTEAIIDPSTGDGSINISKEIGSEVSISGAYVDDDNNSNYRKMEHKCSEVTEFTYGYSNTITGDAITNSGNIATSIKNNWNNVELVGNFTITVSDFNGFTNQINSISNSTSKAYVGAEDGKGSFNLGSIRNEGSNTVTIKFTPPKLYGQINPISAKYIISNLGNKSEEKKSEPTEARWYGEGYEDPKNSKSYTVMITAVGKYRAGIYLTDSGTDITSDKIGELDLLDPTTAGTITQLTEEITVESDKILNIVVPPGYELHQVKANDGFTSIDLSNFNTITVVREVGTVTSRYTVYYMQPLVRTTFKLIQIEKN